jgi:spoIIIJ-associated protein
MAESIEKTGKTVEEACQAALAALGLSDDRVTFEVLEEPTKGFFGLIGARAAKIRATVKEIPMAPPLEPVVVSALPLEKAEHFLQQIFAAMHLDVKMEQRDTDDGHVFNLIGENLGILIGKHGQTLDALQYLANLTANHGLLEARVRIILDVEDYRSRREETLRHLAFRLADKVRHTGEKIMLEPMNRHERKIIHMALQDNYKVTTYSAGDEPYRKVVIEPRHNKE